MAKPESTKRVRLALLCRYHPTSPKIHGQVLPAWYQERIENGIFVSEAQPAKIFVRDWCFWLHGLIRYIHSKGMAFILKLNGGLNLPHVFCKAMSGKVFPAQAFVRTATEGSQGKFATSNIPYTIQRELFQVASVEFTRSALCNEVHAKYIIFRPDRFVSTACEDEKSLSMAIGSPLLCRNEI
ncbi:hypothetical protein BDV29DRAFT_192953 [Aspergillus leporis]|uniref:Uncharacterized protein n=1 Tax=Aspergillus leporis TaxID=41062 RepID=A0A5N5WVV8_9EURO|nr:hypothetical protein BDV29DRAFT_192953 [Aspergillus leporis]